MRQARQLAPHAGEVAAIDLGQRDPLAVRGARHHHAPRIDDQRVPEVREAVRAGARLVRRQEVALVLDRACPAEHLPVRRAGREGEGGRHEQQLRTGTALPAVELREAEVVADRQPERTELGREDDHLGAGGARVGLAHGHASGNVDVEQVDLAVAARISPHGDSRQLVLKLRSSPAPARSRIEPMRR